MHILRALMGTSIVASTTLLAGAAAAWDGADLWYKQAEGALPGGGGILGTGSASDHGITCAHCHTNAAGMIDLQFTFTPTLPLVGGQPTYTPGQSYQVDVKLTGEHLGTGVCDQYMTHVNNFAATFEGDSGKLAGVLSSDSGQTSSSCPPNVPMLPINGTTVLYNDCRAVLASGGEDRTTWTFSWQAPPAGAGTLTLFYGVVDGDCDMSSRGDDVKVGTLKLGEASASLSPPGNSRWAMALASLVPLGLIAARGKRRKQAPRE